MTPHDYRKSLNADFPESLPEQSGAERHDPSRLHLRPDALEWNVTTGVRRCAQYYLSEYTGVRSNILYLYW